MAARRLRQHTCWVEEEDEAGCGEVRQIEVLKELGGAQEGLEDPWLEQVKFRGARERDGRAPRALEGVGRCVEQCEAFYAGHSSKARKEHVDLARSASVRVRNHGRELRLEGKRGAVCQAVQHRRRRRIKVARCRRGCRR